MDKHVSVLKKKFQFAVKPRIFVKEESSDSLQKREFFPDKFVE